MRLGVLLSVLASLIVILLACPLRLAVVSGDSMTPALRSGQLVLIDKGYYRSQSMTPGDIVALRVEGQLIVKRVHAVARSRRRMYDHVGSAKPLVFVTGDASSISWDSRSFGPVPEDRILGHVIGWFGPEPQALSHVARAGRRDG